MQVTINIPEQIAAQAQARGMAVEAYAEELLGVRAREPLSERRRAEMKNAVEQIRKLREGNMLDGIKIRDLIDEGRKY